MTSVIKIQSLAAHMNLYSACFFCKIAKIFCPGRDRRGGDRVWPRQGRDGDAALKGRMFCRFCIPAFVTVYHSVNIYTSKTYQIDN